jgi:hypothetical protein
MGPIPAEVPERLFDDSAAKTALAVLELAQPCFTAGLALSFRVRISSAF